MVASRRTLSQLWANKLDCNQAIEHRIVNCEHNARNT